MMTDAERVQYGGEELSTGEVTIDERAWVVAKSLLEVNDASTRTLESFLLYATTDRMDELPTDQLADRIDDLVEQQTRVLAELELAKDALEELDDA